MSAIHITPEVGRTYLMTDGERVTVTAVSAHTIAGDGTERGWGKWSRSLFERIIDSVLE